MAANAVEWAYDGPGSPENWASLSDEYAPCADGKQQSPVDITGYQTGDAGQLSVFHGGDAKTVRNDGKFVNVDYRAGQHVGRRAAELRVAVGAPPFALGTPYRRREFCGRTASGPRGRRRHALAAVALLFEQGAPSPVVQAILDAAPAASDTVSEGVGLNAGAYAPSAPGYYRYDGSKTTPPCYEPVTWYVMRELKTISPEQVDRLLALSGGPNNRPIQPTGSRTITAGGTP